MTNNSYRTFTNTLAILLIISILQPIIHTLSAKLQLMTYDPLYFNLSFSEPTSYPQFQLLLNQPVISHKAISNTSVISSFYIIEGIIPDDISLNQLVYQNYKLIFSFPLKIGNGSLELSYFLLKAEPALTQQENILLPITEKNGYFAFQSENKELNGLAIAIACLTYFIAITTIIGLNSYFFLMIYVQISLLSPLYTYMDYRIAYYLLIQVHSVSGTQSDQFIYLSIPFLIIAGAFLFGLICRYCLENLAKQSWFWNQVYYLFTYKLFLSVWNIMMIPILINVVHLIQDSDHFTFSIGQYLYIYFGFAIFTLFFMLVFTVLNPQINQSAKSFQKYSKSTHLILFQALYTGIQPFNWKKRNYTLFFMCIRVISLALVAIFLSPIPNLFLQMVILVYFFSIRPFKSDFFNYSNIGIQIATLIFYYYSYTATLFVNMGGELISSTDMNGILLANVILVSIVILAYVFLSLFEIYEKGKDFFINKKQWKIIKQKYYVGKQSDSQQLREGEIQMIDFMKKEKSLSKANKGFKSEIYAENIAIPKNKLGYREASEQIDMKRRRNLKKRQNYLETLEEQKEIMTKKYEQTPQKHQHKSKSKKVIVQAPKKQPGQKQSLLQTVVNQSKQQ